MTASGAASYRLLVRWQLIASASFLPTAIVLQALVGGATVIGFGLLIPDLDSQTATFLTTGGPTFALISLGIAVLPQSVVQNRLTGVYDYFETLPIPRLTYLVAEMTVLLAIALPGMLAALAVAELRFRIHLHPQLSFVPAVLLVVLTSTALGYVVATLVRTPLLVTLASNALLFAVMFFSPINYPPSRLPDWLQAVHVVLPFKDMAVLMRSSLTGASTSWTSWAVVAGWASAALIGTFAAARRRP